MKNDIKDKFLPTNAVELPPRLKKVMKKAKRLEVITLVYQVSVIVVMYFTLSSSQAMKAAWVEDVLGLVPSLTFLVASKYFNRKPNYSFPYGYHRVFSIGFAFGAFSLLAMGIFITFDSVSALIKQEHPTIHHVRIFGKYIWFGWIMILALLYSFIPAVILGRKKINPAKKLHNKLLMIDAKTQKADWMTAGSAIVGIIGIGFGLWWADAVAATFISLSIIKDGVKKLSDSVTDLIGQIPTSIESNEYHPINQQVIDLLEKRDWVDEVRVRLREEGQVFVGEIYVKPKNRENLTENIRKSFDDLMQLDWKMHSVTIQPVEDFNFGINKGKSKN